MFPPSTLALVVDDMSTMRQMVKSQLRNLGIKNLLEADNGQTGLQILQEQLKSGNPVGLVVSDWNMPGTTGLALLKLVRAAPEFKNLPFLMVTAEGEQHQVLDAIRSGVSNYLVKPFTPAAFQEKLAQVWRKHNPTSTGK